MENFMDWTGRASVWVAKAWRVSAQGTSAALRSTWVSLTLAFAYAIGIAFAAIQLSPAEAAFPMIQQILADRTPTLGRESAVTPLVPYLTEAAVKALDVERGCLALAVYHEARGETRDGQRAVAEVVLRRVSNPSRPNSVCGVVLEGAARKNGCQFSFTCDGSIKKRRNFTLWERALNVADYMLDGPGRAQDLTGRATHFHADYVEPGWAGSMEKTVQIGRHIFYRPAPRSRQAVELKVAKPAQS
jgi:spore germination cell wall hydrolase CwlJ-like protein